MDLAGELGQLKGIGEKRVSYLHKLGIYRIFDLLTYFPKGYEDNSSAQTIGNLKAGEVAGVTGIITGLTENQSRRGMFILTATITDGTGFLQITWFNQKYLKRTLKKGKKIFVRGKVAYAYGGQGHFSISQISSFEIIEDKIASQEGKIMPIYGATEKLSKKLLQDLLRNLLKENISLAEFIPQELCEKYDLLPRERAYQQIHFPENMKLLAKAKERIIFEELFLIQCGLLFIKKKHHSQKVGIAHRSNGYLSQKLLKDLPFTLTGDQERTWYEISNDMEKNIPMCRLVQGDVGSGKTIIAILALVKTVENGFQGAMMAPTEILARQHYESFSRLLAPLGIRLTLLSGKVTGKNKKVALDKIATHETDIVIGTHALIQEGVEFAKLGLVVTDEQHRFGIRQRSALEKKSRNKLSPDVLVMTATPIPRTMSLTVYGDLDVSLIKQLPPGRKPVRTFIRNMDRRGLIYEFVLKEIKEGRQAYVVCPLIEASEDNKLMAAEEVYEELAGGLFAGVSCGLLHGRMQQKEKELIMERFYLGEIKLLVATTVIEVGVNVPNASVMVVENAQQFGLAQLHQLRGRIGRGEYASYCILINSGKTESSRERMNIMESTHDGFVLAEEDLKLRGPGQFFGTNQHGLPDLKLADILEDINILLRAREGAIQVINREDLMERILPEIQLFYGEEFLHIREV